MTRPYHDSWPPPDRDPVDARSQDFDWDGLYQRLQEDVNDFPQDRQLAETVTRVLQILLPAASRRIRAESLGVRLIALAWTLNPGYFEGSPSLRQLARRCGVRPATLAAHSGEFSRLLGWRNRAQRHAANWHPTGTPIHRGAGAKAKRLRNVPTLGEGQKDGLSGHPAAGASSGERAPTRSMAVRTLPRNENEREPAENDRDRPKRHPTAPR